MREAAIGTYFYAVEHENLRTFIEHDFVTRTDPSRALYLGERLFRTNDGTLQTASRAHEVYTYASSLFR